MNDNLIPTLRERAADAIADARERVREVATSRIEVSAGRSILATAVLAAGLVASGWLWTKYVRWDERAKFRSEIAAASPRVRGAILAGSQEAEAQDRIIIDSIRGTDNELTQAEANLRDQPTAPPLDGCPRIPARCLGLGAAAGPGPGAGGMR